TAVWTGSFMIVWGGYGVSRNIGTVPMPVFTHLLDSGGLYDPVNDAWGPTSSTGAPTRRDAHTAVWTGSTMVIWGGNSDGAVNTGAIYDPGSDSWTPTFDQPQLPPHSPPDGRYFHSAVWTGSQMIVWGGATPSGFLNTGSKYDPVNDQWTDIASANAPARRDLFSAVWTGTRMIVWGGD